MVDQKNPGRKPVRRSIRLKCYDYSCPGFYFVSICTNKKKPYFGHVTDGAVVLSDLGEVARSYFVDIPKHFDDVTVDQFIIMPDHVHGIIAIQSVGAAYMPPAESLPDDSLPSTPGFLSVIIQQYKSAVRRWSVRNGYDFSWQRGFYEHVVRNENDLDEIRNYIVNNPLKRTYNTE